MATTNEEKPRLEAHTAGEGSLREGLRSPEERGGRLEGLTSRDTAISRPRTGLVREASNEPLVEEKPGVCSTGKGEEYVDTLTGVTIRLADLLKAWE